MEVQNKTVFCTETPLSQNYGDARVAKHLKTLLHSIPYVIKRKRTKDKGGQAQESGTV